MAQQQAQQSFFNSQQSGSQLTLQAGNYVVTFSSGKEINNCSFRKFAE
jgi:hypothetical protein